MYTNIRWTKCALCHSSFQGHWPVTSYLLCLVKLSSAEANFKHQNVPCPNIANHIHLKNPTGTEHISIQRLCLQNHLFNLWLITKRGRFVLNITAEVSFWNLCRWIENKVNPNGSWGVSPHWAGRAELIPGWNISVSLYIHWCFISSYVTRMPQQKMRCLSRPQAQPHWKAHNKATARRYY